ncbi:MAG: cell division protein FtsQ/DivIB [Bacteroidales bacterium]|nr:cell division protein FtsQ/DivIB [Bacteroidales bacterium]
MIHKVFKWVAVLCLFSTAIAYFAFGNQLVQQQERQVICKEVKIEIADSALTRLVLPDDLFLFFNQKNILLAGNMMHEIDLHDLEQLVANESGIKLCQVYTRINGVVTFSLSQRVPLLRLETSRGAFYLDDSGVLFPAVPRRTAYVPIVSGNIPLNDEEWMERLFHLGTYVRNHRFWNAQIEQLHVHQPHNIEIIQRAGTQTTVMMGDLSRFEYKLQKLYTFYRTVAATQGWDKYNYIDIRYGNQIVCRQT